MKKNMSHQKASFTNRQLLSGFSLIELVISISIVSILALVFAPVINIAIESFLFQLNQKFIALEGPEAMSTMVRELRTAEEILAADYASIRFRPAGGATGTWIQYNADQYLYAGPYLKRTASSQDPFMQIDKYLALLCENPPCPGSVTLRLYYFGKDGHGFANPPFNGDMTQIAMVRISLILDNGQPGGRIGYHTLVRLRRHALGND